MKTKISITVLAILLSIAFGAVLAKGESGSITRDISSAESLSEEITRVSTNLTLAQKKANKSLRELLKAGEKISSRYYKMLSALERDAKEEWMHQEYSRLSAQLHAEWDAFFAQARDHVTMAANGEGSPYLTGHLPLSGIEHADNALKCSYFSYAMNPEFHDARIIQSSFEKAVNTRRIAMNVEAELMLLLRQ